MARTPPPNIVILGSLNMDWIAQVDHLPAPGETVAASRVEKRFGGKGANQALAAARQGAQVTLIHCGWLTSTLSIFMSVDEEDNTLTSLSCSLLKGTSPRAN